MTGQVSRKAFLRGALGAVAAGALASGRTTTAEPQTVSSPPPPSSPPTPPRNWAALADAIEGKVIVASDADYAAAKTVFNSRFDDTTPVAVVTATSSDDVVRAMAFAAVNGMTVAPRSGGHSYVGDSAASGVLVVDLRPLGVAPSYDDGSTMATIPAAAQLDSVQTALAQHGRSIPAGSCPTVGIAGLALGGGLGADARQWSLTCDALVSATVVLPSGDVVTASQHEHDDLYWALHGGGGGHFGIVTAFTFRTFPVATRDVVTLTFPESASAQAIFGWNQWLGAADRSIWGMVNIGGSDTGLQCHVVLATAAGAGSDAADDLIAAIGSTPAGNNVKTLPHMDFVHYFEGGTDASRPRAVVAGSDIIGEMTSAAAQSIVDAMSAPHGQVSATVVVESLSGAVNDVAADATAFPWRRQAACLQWYTEPPSPTAADAAQDWLVSAHRTVQAHSVGAYANYLDSDTSPERYFDGNLMRLKEIRQRYDPNGLMYSSLHY